MLVPQVAHLRAQAIVLRMAAGVIAKLKRRMPHKTPARRDVLEYKLGAAVPRRTARPLDANAAGCECGKLFCEVNVSRHVSWTCFSPHLSHVHVLFTADIELDADKGRQPIHARASSGFLVMHGAVALLASAAGVEVACQNNVEDEEKGASNAAHKEVMEGDEAGGLELEVSASHAGGLLPRGRVCYEKAQPGNLVHDYQTQ